MIKRFHSCRKIDLNVYQDTVDTVFGRFHVNEHTLIRVCPYCSKSLYLSNFMEFKISCRACGWGLYFHSMLRSADEDYEESGALKWAIYKDEYICPEELTTLNLSKVTVSLDQLLNAAIVEQKRRIAWRRAHGNRNA